MSLSNRAFSMNQVDTASVQSAMDDRSLNIGDIVKGNVLPYSFPSFGPGADPGVQAVSPQVTF